MKFLWLIFLSGLILGCANNSSFTEPMNIDAGKQAGHFVEVVLPAEDRSRGAEIELSIKGRVPLIQTVDFNSVEAEVPSVRFDVGEVVAPATLEVRFTDGEIRTLSKVIFDTTLTLQ